MRSTCTAFSRRLETRESEGTSSFARSSAACLPERALIRDVPEQNWTTAWKRYEGLRFARLCHYLRARRADASIGHSILIFRLSAAEVAATTGGSAREWQAAIERALANGAVTGPP